MALDKAKTQDINLFYALLFHDIGKPAVAKRVKKDEGWMYSTKGHADASADIFHEFAKKNKFSKQSRSTIEWLIRNHMLQKDFRIMKTKKQIEIAGHPAFELLLDHWQADHHGNLRAEGFDEHTKMYEESISAAKAILRNLKLKKTLIDRLAKGDLIMKYSKLKPGIDLGRKIEDIKAQIVLGKIKTELDLKNYLSTRV